MRFASLSRNSLPSAGISVEFGAKGIRIRSPFLDRLGGAAFGAVSAAICGGFNEPCCSLLSVIFRFGVGGGITGGTFGVSLRADATSAAFSGLLGAGIKSFGGAVGALRTGGLATSCFGAAATGAVGAGAVGRVGLETMASAGGVGGFAMAGFGVGVRVAILGGVAVGMEIFGGGGAFGRFTFGTAETCGAAGAGAAILGGSIFGTLSTGRSGIFRVLICGFGALGTAATCGASGGVEPSRLVVRLGTAGAARDLSGRRAGALTGFAGGNNSRDLGILCGGGNSLPD